MVDWVEKRNSQFVIWGIIEGENKNSLSVMKRSKYYRLLDSKPHMKIYPFSRMFPKKKLILTQKVTNEALSCLDNFYQNLNFYTQEDLGFQNQFFSYSENGEILYCIQATTVLWKFKQLYGVPAIDKLVLGIGKHFPMNRIVNPANHHFAYASAFYCKEGQAPGFEDFLETVLTHLGVHSLWAMIDNRSPLATTFKNIKKPGLQSLVGPSGGGIINYYSHDMGHEDSELLPSYLPSLDSI